MVTRVLKVSMVVVLAGGLVAALPPAVRDWGEAKYDLVIHWFEQDTPDSQHIKKAERGLREFEEKVKDMTVAVGKLSDQVAAQKAALGKEEAELAAALRGLDAYRKQLTCAAQSTAAEAGDLRDRAERALREVRTREASVTGKQEQLAGTEAARQDAARSLQEALRVRDRMRTELESLKARLQAANVRRDANKALAEVSDPAGAESELSRTMERLRNRERAAKHEAEFYHRTPTPPAEPRPARPLVEQMNEVLERNGVGRR